MLSNPSVIVALFILREERIGKRGKRIKDAVVYKSKSSLDISDGWKEGGQVHFINVDGEIGK